jgi:hypothetical protein
MLQTTEHSASLAAAVAAQSWFPCAVEAVEWAGNLLMMLVQSCAVELAACIALCAQHC